MKRSRAFVLVILGNLFACHSSSNSRSDSGASDLSASHDAATGDAASGNDLAAHDGSLSSSDAGGSCNPPMTYGGGETSMTGASVTAKIVDETGAAVSGQPIFISGLDIASAPSMTASDGTVTISTTLTEKKPAFKYGDAINYAEFGIPLTTATTDFTTGGKVLATGKLSDKTGATLTPGTSATSGDVTVTLPTSAVVGIDPIVYTTSDSQKLRTVKIPLTNVGPVLDPVMVGGTSANFALLYGVAPAESTLCPPGQITVALSHTTTMPNDQGWAAGTKVEFWITTLDTAQMYAPYAGWAKMSDGVVSSDGMSVSTVSGQGFNYLESFAIRKAN